jgi:SAM-dependent methyltransferase
VLPRSHGLGELPTPDALAAAGTLSRETADDAPMHADCCESMRARFEKLILIYPPTYHERECRSRSGREMDHDNESVLAYWNRQDVESMYDKHLLNAEIELIRRRIPVNAKILDAGCGEGEGTVVYSAIAGVEVHAVDFSETRLAMARQRLSERSNVLIKQLDFLKEYSCDYDYDVVISQRFLINLLEWPLQQRVLLDLARRLKSGGRLLMLEGSQQGVDSLNELRSSLGLELIPVKWHNLFFDDDALIRFMLQNDYRLIEQDGLGAYFMLTRGIRPTLDADLDWNCEFNRLAALPTVSDQLGFRTRFSRLKLFVFEK